MRWLGLGLLAGLLLLRLLLADHLGLAEDEAYYWCWSEALDWGYFDHPPGIAGLIRLGTTLAGDTELGVRLGGLLASTLALGWALHQEGWRPRSLLLLLASPVLLVLPMLATPDVLLISAWLAALVAWEQERDWLAGLFTGLALLAKLTGWVLLGALVLSAWRQPKRLRGLALAPVMATPWLWWNAQNDWVSIGFQLDHGLGGEAPGLWGLLEFMGAQAGLVGPVLLIAGLVWLARPRWQDAWWWSAVLPLALFGLASTLSRGEGNWGAPVWVGVLVGLGRAEGRLGRAAEVGGWVAAAISLLVLTHAWTPVVQLPKDPLLRLARGPFIGPPVEAWGVEPVLTSRYQEAALIRFYGGIDATTVPDTGRRDQFDLWPRDLPERTVFVRRARRSEELATDLLYPEHGPAYQVVARDAQGLPFEIWQVHEVWGYDSQ